MTAHTTHAVDDDEIETNEAVDGFIETFKTAYALTKANPHDKIGVCTAWMISMK